MTDYERKLRRELQYQGRVAGVAPVYIGLFSTDEEGNGSKDFSIIMAKPMTGWILAAVEWLWNTVATITNKDSYVGSYAIKITGTNLYYDPVEQHATDSDE